jgi:hypothetical protein
VDVLVYEPGVFVLDDGHHRYLAARLSRRRLSAQIAVKGKPVEVLLERAGRAALDPGAVVGSASMATKNARLNHEIREIVEREPGGSPKGETPNEYLARADQRRGEAARLRAERPVGYRDLAAAHDRTAHAYEELARARGASLPKRQIPGIAAWNKFAGGSSAPPDQHSYSLNVPEGEYHVSPVSDRGRRRGYSLQFAARQQPRGGHSGSWHDLGTHRSPAVAAAAARRHYAASY